MAHGKEEEGELKTCATYHASFQFGVRSKVHQKNRTVKDRPGVIWYKRKRFSYDS